MASKSGGTIPPDRALVDINQAMALLLAMHFWSIKKINRGNGQVRYLVDITHAGRRVGASRKTVLGAITAALDNLREHRTKDDAAEPAPAGLKMADYTPVVQVDAERVIVKVIATPEQRSVLAEELKRMAAYKQNQVDAEVVAFKLKAMAEFMPEPDR